MNEDLHQYKVYVHKSGIEANKRTRSTDLPVITAENEQGEKEHCYGLEIYGQDGKLAARIVYYPNDPLPNGVRVWIEAAQIKTKNEYFKKA